MWKDAFKEGQELVLATSSSDAKPNANVVMSLGFVDDKLLIADSQMRTTLKNLKETKQVCIVTKSKDVYYRVTGSVQIFNSGKYVDLCNQRDKKYSTKNAILVTIKSVFDLDKMETIL
ncbi:MAG: pyridoxamine 5'-phosphate oxidase family protein [Nanoarchaeota archaeon]|nr:pyridoxamine 5'-phosphate oxidase family protein [Nanoarchaeota archaeon]